jgi:fructokinase
VILVAGEALIDLVAGEDGTVAAHPGGGPFNAARTIGRLRQEVAFLGRLSSDRFGRTLERMLVDDGVGLGPVVRTNDPTTLAVAELDDAGGARYRFYAQGTSAAGLTTADALDALPARVDVLHAGSLGLVLEPVAGAVEALVEHLAGDALVVVDPNCRPWAIDDPVAYRARLDRVLRRADVLKVSEDDLAWLNPDRPATQAARELLAGGGPPVALVTLGPDGAAVVTERDEVAVPAPPVEVADTIGAGDAFGGGFAAWWRAHDLGRAALGDLDAVVEAARYASRVAALTCERPGASPPWLAEVE